MVKHIGPTVSEIDIIVRLTTGCDLKYSHCVRLHNSAAKLDYQMNREH